MILFLVDYECHDKNGADLVLEALNKAAQYQVDNSIMGVVTYHFTRPNADKPNLLRFVELYASDPAFWEHSSHPSVYQELLVTFDPTIRKSFKWGALYSEDVDQQVKNTVINMNGYELVPIVSAFNPDTRPLETKSAVLCIAHLADTKHAISSLESLSPSFSSHSLYHFLVRNLDDDLHMVTLWPSQDAAVQTLESSVLPKLEFKSLQIYATGNNQRISHAFSPWPVQFVPESDAGYILHPEFIQN